MSDEATAQLEGVLYQRVPVDCPVLGTWENKNVLNIQVLYLSRRSTASTGQEFDRRTIESLAIDRSVGRRDPGLSLETVS